MSGLPVWMGDVNTKWGLYQCKGKGHKFGCEEVGHTASLCFWSSAVPKTKAVGEVLYFLLNRVKLPLGSVGTFSD